MAVKSTKTKSKTRAKKKPASQKRTTKRRTRRVKKKSNFKKNIFIVLGVLFVIFLVAFGYFLGNNGTTSSDKKLKNKTVEKNKKNPYSTNDLLSDLSKMDVSESEVIKKKKSSVKFAKTKKVVSKPPNKKLKAKKKKPVSNPNVEKPKLAIVIDDVSNVAQMKRIKGTGLKLTPSIFPPSELSMTSHKLAVPLEHYMIHLPMESGNEKFNTQHKTLLVKNSMHTIEQRVQEIRRLFPKGKYLNNHTGSVFTNDYVAMYKLYKALDKQGFVFIDSRTVGTSKVRKIAREFDHRYISRDIFIDNEHNIPYIHQQLKKVVRIAKKNGYAIAIGHPHKITMEALQQAKEILDDVEVVYIDDMFKK